MTNMADGGDVSRRAGDWLIGTAMRHPEALLVLAAGVALLMRGGEGSFRGAPTPSGNQAAGSAGRGQIPRTTEKATEIVSDLKDRAMEVTSSVSDYAAGVGRTISSQTSQIAGQAKDRAMEVASSVSDYAAGVGRTISSQTSQIAGQAQAKVQTGFGYLVQEQPLALVALGLAAGAAVATLLPSTTVEERTLTPARDAIAEAATDAGQRLTQGIAERASEGVKELVRDVGDTVIDKISGKPQNPGALPRNVSTLPNRGS